MKMGAMAKVKPSASPSSFWYLNGNVPHCILQTEVSLHPFFCPGRISPLCQDQAQEYDAKSWEHLMIISAINMSVIN